MIRRPERARPGSWPSPVTAEPHHSARCAGSSISAVHEYREGNCTGATPDAGSEWTADGSTREQRQLKHRAEGDSRIVPTHPELTKILRDHLAQFESTPDGRLFSGVRGGELPASTRPRSPSGLGTASTCCCGSTPCPWWARTISPGAASAKPCARTDMRATSDLGLWHVFGTTTASGHPCPRTVAPERCSARS